MRLNHCLILGTLIASPIALGCTDLTVSSCPTLTIDSIQNLKASGGSPIVINVTGDVEINADIILDGGDGFTMSANGTMGPQGGPGAEEGGGLLVGEGQPQFGMSASSGLAPTNDPVCNNGGGGGGFISAGGNGSVCATATTAMGLGGSIVSSSEFDFTGPFRGGFGGGAGGADETSPGVFSIGSGAGGGGALHIISGGTIKIKNGVRITARGGNGGNASAKGGGGGAGSGGVIWLQSSVSILNQGVIDVSAGRGGRNASTGVSGGQGGNGVYRLESSSGIVSGNGVLNSSSSSSSLKSDISCGTIGKPNENKNQFFQMMVGFGLVYLLAFFTKNRRVS